MSGKKPKVSPQAAGRSKTMMKEGSRARGKMIKDTEKKLEQLHASEMSAIGKEFRRGDRVKTPAEDRAGHDSYTTAATRGKTKFVQRELAARRKVIKAKNNRDKSR